MKKTIKIKEALTEYEEKVSCNGGDGDTGHPKVYLVISSKKGYVNCPYCGKKYKKPK